MNGEYSEREYEEYKRRIDERFLALTKELQLQADKEYLTRETYISDRKDKLALWLALGSLALNAYTLFTVLPKGVTP